MIKGNVSVSQRLKGNISGFCKPDKTLTMAGHAADAKAAGKAVKRLSERVDEYVKKIWRG